jgi:hypothetical protein
MYYSKNRWEIGGTLLGNRTYNDLNMGEDYAKSK